MDCRFWQDDEIARYDRWFDAAGGDVEGQALVGCLLRFWCFGFVGSAICLAVDAKQRRRSNKL
jgi:hypothetical protein